ncbi:MAG TPA: hypothetical protein VFU07_03060 [Candidatus Lumbricidophila sp.]|nr:hypothetical protein [Candidatus Lumbricidophila sp.]
MLVLKRRYNKFNRHIAIPKTIDIAGGGDSVLRMRILSNKKTVLASALLLVGSQLIVGAAPANAAGAPMPSGCSLAPSTPAMSGAYVWFGASGYCPAGNGVSRMMVELIHNYDVFPDAWAWDTWDWYGPGYSASATTCDGGGTTQYYTRASFYRSAGDVWQDSAMKTLTHC